MFFEQGMRGRVSYINKRYSEASINVNILYLDMNNLNGYLPISDFKWVKNIKQNRTKTNEYQKIIAQLDMNLKVDLEFFFFFFFLSGFSFTNIHDSRDSRGRGRVSI